MDLEIAKINLDAVIDMFRLSIDVDERETELELALYDFELAIRKDERAELYAMDSHN